MAEDAAKSGWCRTQCPGKKIFAFLSASAEATRPLPKAMTDGGSGGGAFSSVNFFTTIAKALRGPGF